MMVMDTPDPPPPGSRDWPDRLQDYYRDIFRRMGMRRLFDHYSNPLFYIPQDGNAGDEGEGGDGDNDSNSDDNDIDKDLVLFWSENDVENNTPDDSDAAPENDNNDNNDIDEEFVPFWSSNDVENNATPDDTTEVTVVNTPVLDRCWFCYPISEFLKLCVVLYSLDKAGMRRLLLPYASAYVAALQREVFQQVTILQHTVNAGTELAEDVASAIRPSVYDDAEVEFSFLDPLDRNDDDAENDDDGDRPTVQPDPVDVPEWGPLPEYQFPQHMLQPDTLRSMQSPTYLIQSLRWRLWTGNDYATEDIDLVPEYDDYTQKSAPPAYFRTIQSNRIPVGSLHWRLRSSILRNVVRPCRGSSHSVPCG